MKPVLRLPLICFFASILIVGTALADEVLLENGNRFTGKVLRLDAGRLFFATDYAGKINIDWQKVVSLTTDGPVTVVIKDGTTRPGVTFTGTSAAVATKTEPASAAIDLAAVKEINTKPKPPIKITARVNAGFSREKGNTDTEQTSFDGELIARKNRHRLSLGGAAIREEADGSLTSRNWRAYGKYDYFIKKRWFLYASTLFENDDFADLDLRSTYGVGGGHQFFESDDLNLSVSGGFAYVSENFIQAENVYFSAAQWLVRYDQYVLKNTLQLFHDNNGYISLEDANTWLINTRQGIRFPFYKGLTLTFQYNYDYNNDPSPEAISNFDSRLLFLLGWAFEN